MSGEERAVWMPGGVRTEIHLDRAEPAGGFCLLVLHSGSNVSAATGWELPSSSG